MTLSILSLVVGLSLAGTILFLVRRDHLHGPYALGWLLLAVLIIIVAIVPASIDWVGQAVGIYYPPILLCLLAIAALLIKSLVSDLERSRQERKIRRLSQKLAIIERELADLRESQGLPPLRPDHEHDDT